MLRIWGFKLSLLVGLWACLWAVPGVCELAPAIGLAALDVAQGLVAGLLSMSVPGLLAMPEQLAGLSADQAGLLFGVGFAGTTVAQSSSAMTLAEWAKLQDPDGKVAIVANLLSQTNEILEDAVFMEGNLPTGHRVTVATGLPAVYWRSYNTGVPSSKATFAQVDEAIGMLEAYAVVDKDLALLNGNTAAFRLQEDQLFLEAMNQTQAKTLFYGNPATDSRAFMGLAPRYSNLAAGNAANILDAGGTGSTNTSIWLVVWGENTVFCPFPKGSKAGLIHDDQGEVTTYDSNQNRYQALQTHYQWKNGLCVKDWRYAVRVANIQVSAGSNPPITADLLSLMSRALDRIPNLGMGRACFYMNRTVFSMLRLQALNKSNMALAIEPALSQFGTPQRWTTFMGVPLRKVDGILNTESQVTTTS